MPPDIEVADVAGHARVHVPADREEAARFRRGSESRRAYPGPVITRYEIDPLGVKGNQVLDLVRDLARALSVMASMSSRTIPSKSYMGSIPDPTRQTVRLSEILGLLRQILRRHGLALHDGATTTSPGVHRTNLARMPHLLVAARPARQRRMDAMILSLVSSSPSRCTFILIDPKMLELSVSRRNASPSHAVRHGTCRSRRRNTASTEYVAEMERHYEVVLIPSACATSRLQSKAVRDTDEARHRSRTPLTSTPIRKPLPRDRAHHHHHRRALPSHDGDSARSRRRLRSPPCSKRARRIHLILERGAFGRRRTRP